MISIVCDECGAEARTEVSACPRCHRPFGALLSDAADHEDDDYDTPASKRSAWTVRLRAMASLVTLCVVAWVGLMLWAARTPEAAPEDLVAVGKIETSADVLANAGHPAAADSVHP
jgi:hypothetical protein